MDMLGYMRSYLKQRQAFWATASSPGKQSMLVTVTPLVEGMYFMLSATLPLPLKQRYSGKPVLEWETLMLVLAQLTSLE